MKRRRTCSYCKRTFYASNESFAENPFCRHCLHDRLATASLELGPVLCVKLDNGYVLTRSVRVP